MKKILIVCGTRPEVIKIAPVVFALRESKEFLPIICSTSQHREMQDQMLKIFGIAPDYDLNVMQPNQDLNHITSAVIERLKSILVNEKPDMVLVQGDTTTAFAAALAAFYQKIPVGHIEAGLRTNDIYAPFPEEANRQLVSRISSLHFAPTEQSKINLLNEGTNPNNVYVTGNTVIDALFWMKEHFDMTRILNVFPREIVDIIENKRFILITGHRRENLGDGFKEICLAVESLAKKYPDCHFIYPVHLNPNVRSTVMSMLGGLQNIHLIEPVTYEPFLYLLNTCYLVLTDSGGVQEEAPSLGKPVLVMRDVTERPEGVAAGTAYLVGANSKKIIEKTSSLMDDSDQYKKMANAVNPYGDGKASLNIVDILLKYFKV